MFEDVPERLTNFVRDLPKSHLGAKRYFWAAALVSVEYLRKVVVGPDAEPSPGFLDGDVNSIRYSVRVTLLGETLFILRKCSGFPEMCRRLRDRDIRSTFFELMIARLFWDAGFDVLAQPETGTRGEDFDFVAAKHGSLISVEVTAFKQASFSPRTLMNKLQQKRKQLSDKRPAVIYCVYPESWESGDRQFDFFHITQLFFSKTERVNAVVFLGERSVVNERGGNALLFSTYTVGNQRCRFPTEHLQFLYDDTSRTKRLDRILKSGSDIGELVDHFRESEFYQWVDYAVSLAPGGSDAKTG